MSQFHKASITLTEAHHAAAMAAIERGEYASMSEVVREAMREWTAKRFRRAYRVEDLPGDLVRALERADIPAEHKAYNHEVE